MIFVPVKATRTWTEPYCVPTTAPSTVPERGAAAAALGAAPDVFEPLDVFERQTPWWRRRS